MDASLLATRLLLAAILAVAGAAKLADPAGSRKAVTDFGLPARVAAPLALLLPGAELLAAVLLLPAFSAWWGALLALSLFVSFAVGIALNLTNGRKPDCHCLGQLHSEPVGWRAVARSGVLVALGVFVAWQGPAGAGPSAVAWLGDLLAWQAALLAVGAAAAAVIAGQTWFLRQLLRQHGQLLLRLDALDGTHAGRGHLAPHEDAPPQGLPVRARVTLEGLRSAGRPVLLQHDHEVVRTARAPVPLPTRVPGSGAAAPQPIALLVGAPAPALDLPDLEGGIVRLEDFRGRNLALLFWNPGCGFCSRMLPDLRRWEADLPPGAPDLLVVSSGSVKANRAIELRSRVVLDQGLAIRRAFGVTGTPSAVLVGVDGTVMSTPGLGAAEVLFLLGSPAVAQTFPEGKSEPTHNRHLDALARALANITISRRDTLNRVLAQLAVSILVGPFTVLQSRAAWAACTPSASPNEFCGTCQNFANYVTNTGVQCPDGSREPGFAGCTTPNFYIGSNPTNVTYAKKRGVWCATGNVNAVFSADPKVTVLNWIPESPPITSCAQEIARWKNVLIGHEQLHVQDAVSIRDKYTAKWADKIRTACNASGKESKEDAKDRLLQLIKAELSAEMIAMNDEFNLRDGTSPQPFDLDCSKCACSFCNGGPCCSPARCCDNPDGLGGQSCYGDGRCPGSE